MDQMRTLKQRLMSLEKDIRVGIVGIGAIGKGLVYQVNATPGMRPAAIADVLIQRAIDSAQQLKIDFEIANTLADLNYIVQCGKLAITDNADLISSSGLIHVMVESTNSAFHGAFHGLKAIRNHQHVVMMNHDADLMYGSLLFRAAQEEGVVYSCCDGDQPATIKKLIDEIDLCGLDIAMVGANLGKLDRYSDPAKIAAEAEKKGLNPKFHSSLVDGTNLNINMAVLANSINGMTLRSGMNGHPVTQINDLLRHVNLDNVWNGKNPIVDFTLKADPSGCVFVIGRAKDSMQQHMLNQLSADIGQGPYYIFTRPFYLGQFEAIQCIADAYLEGTARLQPLFGSRTNVISYAKRHLKQGEILDGTGGFQSYGLIENLEDAAKPGLPILLSENLKLKRDIGKDQRITLEDVEFNGDDLTFSLFFQALEMSKLRRSPKVQEPISESYQFV
jgi:predicted homoserine dehydrogenase-like protein